MKKYKAVFFDLDHTLWDFERNSSETILELFEKYNLLNLGVTEPSRFISVYKEVNARMWDMYHKNEISKKYLRTGRFNLALKNFGIQNDELAEMLATDYLSICPEKKYLFPGTIEILDYLSEKYKLHIITNGFVEVQYKKIKNSGLTAYFDHIHISEEIGFKKPEPEIFNFAVKQAGVVHENCIMIGDNTETDIGGALNAGIDHILFNPDSTKIPDFVNRSVSSLNELTRYL